MQAKFITVLVSASHYYCALDWHFRNIRLFHSKGASGWTRQVRMAVFDLAANTKTL